MGRVLSALRSDVSGAVVGVMTRKEGGGRESGGDGEGAASRVQREPATTSPSGEGRVAVPAAADPAACPIRSEEGTVYPTWHQLHDARIRELEAERDSMFKAVVEERKETHAAMLRAERAEARVKDLEARLRDEHDDIPDQVELRGEDRG